MVFHLAIVNISTSSPLFYFLSANSFLVTLALLNESLKDGLQCLHRLLCYVIYDQPDYSCAILLSPERGLGTSLYDNDNNNTFLK